MKVLLALDNSKFSVKVLEEVAQRNWSDNTEFVILDVVPRCSLPGSTERFAQQRKILLEGSVAILSRRLPNVKVTGEVVDGAAAEEILAYATDLKADLIIMGAHGESGIKRRIGNVVMSVLNEAPCSVEVVRPRVSSNAAPSKMETRQNGKSKKSASGSMSKAIPDRV